MCIIKIEQSRYTNVMKLWDSLNNFLCIFWRVGFSFPQIHHVVFLFPQILDISLDSVEVMINIEF